jgi:hypothetical protein
MCRTHLDLVGRRLYSRSTNYIFAQFEIWLYTTKRITPTAWERWLHYSMLPSGSPSGAMTCNCESKESGIGFKESNNQRKFLMKIILRNSAIQCKRSWSSPARGFQPRDIFKAEIKYFVWLHHESLLKRQSEIGERQNAGATCAQREIFSINLRSDFTQQRGSRLQREKDDCIIQCYRAVAPPGQCYANAYGDNLLLISKK